jgi:aminoglycoside phosphotransferase (APT) family kinase protein
MSRRTLEWLERARRDASLSSLARALPATRRIVSSLSLTRRQLSSEVSDRVTTVHGDVHSGNAMLRRKRARLVPVLIDWARTRVASPFEDVHSWLHSLGFWEPEARRRHDTLVSRYLSAMGQNATFHSDRRGAYWLAGASNALAGALLYHLLRLFDPGQPSHARGDAFRASKGWLRVLRRADAYWS